MVILGIDPGFARIGYGIIEKNGGTITYKSSGLIETNNLVFTERTLFIERGLLKIIKEEKPDKAGVEKLFFSKNKKTALGVSEARGVILNTLAKNKIETLELSPSEIKMGLTGNGNSSKKEVAYMVSKILNIDTSKVIDDTTDALAVAITSAYTKIYS